VIDDPIDISNIEGDVIGTDTSGTGNIVGKDVHYTVTGNVFNINSPSSEYIQELRRILVVPNDPSVGEISDTKVASTIHELRTIDKHIEEILDLLRVTDTKRGMATKEIKAGEIAISRVDLLLKRAIMLIEQANRYWNVVSKNSDINMYRTKLKEAYRLLQEAFEIDQFNTGVLLYMAKIQGKLMPYTNQIKMREILYRIQGLLEIPHDDIEKFHLAQATFLLATSEKLIDEESLRDAREMFMELGRRDWQRQCDDLLQPEEKTMFAKVWYKKAVALERLNRYEQAIQCFDKAIEIDATDMKIWNSKGSLLGSLGRYEQAIQCFDKAIEIDPHNLAVLRNKGTALHYLGRYEQAIQCFDMAIEKDVNDSDTWSGRGVSLDYLCKYEEAIQCFDKAIKANPRNDDAWYNKAVALDYLKKYEDAVACYNKALDINPDNTVAWYGKGTSLRKLKKYEDAIMCYNKALDINPDNTVAWIGKSLGFESLGDHKKAQEYMDKAKELMCSAANTETPFDEI
jgi:tetratricopeptide (TPR) repeat protein